jgi:hypothetical protein
VHLDEMFRDGEAETGTFAHSLRRRTYLVELVEDRKILVRGDADSRIFHRETAEIRLVGGGGRNRDASAWRSELYRITQQIEHHFLEAHRVGTQKVFAGNVRLHDNRFTRRRWPHAGHNVAHSRGRGENFRA